MQDTREYFPVNSFYDSVYTGELPTNQYFLFLFNKIVSKHYSKMFYDKSILDYFLKEGFIVHSKNEGESRHQSNQTNEEILLVNNKKELIIKINQISDKKTKLSRIEITYSMLNGELDTQLDFIEINKFKRERQKSSIHLVKSDMGQLDTEEFDLPIPDIDIELNYGKDFVKMYEIFIKRLNNEDDKGIILLHGDPGTGKTTFLKYLTKFIKNKEILFIPPAMAETLSDPSIIPFLMEKKNSILIIEDAERVISDRESNGSPVGVSNLLNLTDGILGDCLNIQVIATFNMAREKIDKALLRKGRLIGEWDFKPLNIDNSNKLLKKLFPEKDYKTDKAMLLSDIYGYEMDDLSIKNDKRVGF